ncbi:MAG: type II secretion system F family protein [Thermoplasmata archaeon]|jgi:flagellar protein FlaJ|nr:type II secretion system F family protein [Thermoplasmata archaeon]
MYENAEAAADIRPAATPAKAKKGDDAFTASYRAFCYRLLGQRYDRGEVDVILSERLKQAGLSITPGMHLAVVQFTTVLAFVASLVFGLVFFLETLHSPMWYVYVALIVLVTVGAVRVGFGSVISNKIANRKDQLDRELPFTLSELSVLASTGASPITLVHRMAARDHDPGMTGEFKRVVYKTDIQGEDLITALAETAKESPSTTVREAFWDLANMIHQGGSLDEYLRNKADDVLKLKRLVQKEFIERLSTFLDMYVSLVLVGVLMIAVGAFLLNSLGQTAAGLDSNQLLLVLTFGLVPLAVIMTVIMISIAYARAE